MGSLARALRYDLVSLALRVRWFAVAVAGIALLSAWRLAQGSVGRGLGEAPSLADCAVHLFAGDWFYDPALGLHFLVSPEWMAIQLALIIGVGFAACTELRSDCADAVILRMRSLRVWLLSKALAVLIVVAALHAVALAVLAAFSLTQGGLSGYHAEIAFASLGSLAEPVSAPSPLPALLCPLAATIALALLLQALSLRLRSELALGIVVALMVAADYAAPLTPLGAAGMLARNAAFVQGGLDPALLLGCSVALAAASVAASLAQLSRIDVAPVRRG